MSFRRVPGLTTEQARTSCAACRVPRERSQTEFLVRCSASTAACRCAWVRCWCRRAAASGVSPGQWSPAGGVTLSALVLHHVVGVLCVLWAWQFALPCVVGCCCCCLVFTAHRSQLRLQYQIEEVSAPRHVDADADVPNPRSSMLQLSACVKYVSGCASNMCRCVHVFM